MEGYDKLKAYTNVNLAAIFTNEDAGWKVMAYIKNVFDRDSITGAFLNSDDTGLTTNVFLTEPRLYGLRVTKEWSGGPWWTGASLSGHEGPYALTVELGGQVQRQEAPYEKFQPDFDADPTETLDIFGDAQNRDLDWGDGRELKVSYRPGSGPWAFSAGLRYGRTNNETTRINVVEETEGGCAFGPPFDFLIPLLCASDGAYYDPDYIHATTNWSNDTARDRERHEFIDFAVSRDFGLGTLNSSFGLGMRGAEFESDTWITMEGVFDRVILDGWYLPGIDSFFDQYKLGATVHREFTGWGPIAQWDAALPLLGDDDTGRLALDWSISGGVLFGDQSSSIEGEQQVFYNRLDTESLTPTVLDIADPEPFGFKRSDNATVNTFGMSFGLAYDIQRVRVGAGYRWERYFDVLDVGQGEKQEADRTIDGPYFKIAIGFGG